MRRLILAAAVLASTATVAAPSANAQMMGNGGMPPGCMPQMPQMSACAPAAAPQAVPARAPMATAAVAAAPATPESCRMGVARAAYPFAIQLVQFANATQAYPFGPNGRPLLAGAPFQYPGFAGSIYNPIGSPGYNLANYYGGQNLAGLPFTANYWAPFINGGTPYGDLVANVFAADSQRLAYLDNRINAAALNAAMTIFPLDMATGFKEVIEGLALYADLACAEHGGNGDHHHNNHNHDNNNAGAAMSGAGASAGANAAASAGGDRR